MKRVWQAGGFLLAIALIAYFMWFSWHNLDLRALADVLRKPRTILALLVASALYMMIYPMTGVAWRGLLRRQGQLWESGELTWLISITQLAKYLPGNIAQHASRAGLSLRRGMPMQPYAATVVQETLLACAASIIVGTAFLAMNAALPSLSRYGGILGVMFICSVAGVALLCMEVPRGLRDTSSVLARRLLRLIGPFPGAATTLKALAAYSVNYMLIGLGIWGLALALGMADSVSYTIATAAFALSWILGFLAPGAPAGLGAREGIMVLVLQGQGSDDQIVQLVLLTRAATMTGDALVFSCAAFYSKHIKPRTSVSE